jgi:uncharacterized protein GlcG (DUF336 family)
MTLTVQANTLINAAFAKRHELGLKPPAITVHNAGGHTIACPRQDGGRIALGEARHVNAWSTLALGAPAAPSERWLSSARTSSPLSSDADGDGPRRRGDRLSPNGTILGAIGVTGRARKSE